MQNDQATWSDEKVDLAGLSFQAGSGYTADQWCNLKVELQREWDWLDQVKTLFDAYKQPFLRSGASELIDLQTLGDDVKNSVHPNGNAAVGWDVFSVIGEVANVASFFPEEGAIGALIDSIQSAYDLSSEFATGGGSPLPDQVDSKVQALSQQVATPYSDVAASMDNLRDVVISDYRRLSTLGPLAPTPSWAIGNAVWLLLSRPEQAAAVARDPSLLAPALEETLRYEPPVTLIPRIALEDLEVGGVTIPAGAIIQLSIAAANRDPSRFPDPDVFDLTRDPRGVISFGHGPHGCLGARLAREQALIALRVLFERLEGMRVDSDAEIRWYRNAANRGPDELRVTFAPVR